MGFRSKMKLQSEYVHERASTLFPELRYNTKFDIDTRMKSDEKVFLILWFNGGPYVR